MLKLSEKVWLSRKRFCIDCRKLLSIQAWYFNYERCPKCKHKGNLAPKYKDGKTLKNNYCMDCNKKITYLSIRCKSCANSVKAKIQFSDPKNNPMYGIHRFGPTSPTYIDGRSYEKYPPEFNSKLKEKIHERDNYECQNCGMTDEEHIIVYGRHIEVHHIDYNRNNCNKSNLITACKSCNIRFNKNRQYWKKLLTDKIRNGKTF